MRSERPLGISIWIRGNMKSERGHETIEHTADMGISGWGRTAEEAFEEIALAMFELMIDGEGVEPRTNVEIRVEGADEEELLVDFLNTLLTRADIEELVFLDVKMICSGIRDHKCFLVAIARGVPIGEVRDRLLREVKAVTYYGVSVENIDSGNARATVVVDL